MFLCRFANRMMERWSVAQAETRLLRDYPDNQGWFWSDQVPPAGEARARTRAPVVMWRGPPMALRFPAAGEPLDLAVVGMPVAVDDIEIYF